MIRVQAVLFDLDGTLIDSAPDLAGAANDLREAHGLPELPYASLRPMVGTGARGMIGVAFGLTPADPRFAELRDDFLARYEARMTRLTHVFEAMRPVLDHLDAAGLSWGIVTNKAARLAVPLVEALGLATRSRVLVCGDTTPHSKPHPAPLLEAARRIGVAPERCVYVGDDLRDVEAGRAARMVTVAAAWGYLGTSVGAAVGHGVVGQNVGESNDASVDAGVGTSIRPEELIEAWSADYVARVPGDLLHLPGIA